MCILDLRVGDLVATSEVESFSYRCEANNLFCYSNIISFILLLILQVLWFTYSLTTSDCVRSQPVILLWVVWTCCCLCVFQTDVCVLPKVPHAPVNIAKKLLIFIIKVEKPHNFIIYLSFCPFNVLCYKSKISFFILTLHNDLITFKGSNKFLNSS